MHKYKYQSNKVRDMFVSKVSHFQLSSLLGHERSSFTEEL